MYSADGLSHALRLFFLPQWDGDLSPVAIVGSNGDVTTITHQQFATNQLGVGPDYTWPSLGWLLLIFSGAAGLMILFHVKINHTKR